MYARAGTSLDMACNVANRPERLYRTLKHLQIRFNGSVRLAKAYFPFHRSKAVHAGCYNI